MSTLLDYLPASTLVVKQGDIEAQALHFWRDIESRYEDYGHDIERPLLAPKKLFLFTDEMFSGLKSFLTSICKKARLWSLKPIKDFII